MTTPEWTIALIVVCLLWIGGLWFFLVDLQEKKRRREMETRHQEAESIRNEIARWREASTRTYERQGIRRNR